MKGALKNPFVILVVCALLLPPFTSLCGLTTTTASEILIYALAGLGFNLLLGYTGLVSFGHGIFFGVAAYAASIIQVQLMPDAIFTPMILAVLFATALGAGIGYLSLRLSGVYFSLLTLSFAAMSFYIIYRWTSFTGGEDGYGGMQRPVLFGIDLNNQMVFFYLVFAVFAMSTLIILRVVNSPLGSVLKAIRENSQRAAFLGYNVRKFRFIAFTLSAFFVAVAGSMFPFLKYYIGAELVHVQHSGEILAMSILGGAGHFMGPALGGLFFILFRELLSEYTASWQLLFGLMFMGFILFSPGGLMRIGEVLLAPLLKRKSKAAMTARLNPAMKREIPACLRNATAETASGPIFECRGISKFFGNFAAVREVTLAVNDRSLQALIGPNGAGKTSLFNILSGEYRSDSGELYFQGRRITDFSVDALSRQGIARSFQITNLFQGLTVAENIRLAVQSRYHHAANFWSHVDSFGEVDAETESLITFLGLEGLEQVSASDLSYGGQRLLEIGLAVATRPRVLLLDEPLVGLSAQERERVIVLIKSLAEYIAVLLIEHDIDRVLEFSDFVIVMNEATVLASGRPDEVRSDTRVQEAYLGSGKAVITRQAETVNHINCEKTILQVRDIDTFYGKSHILNRVSMDVRQSEVVALLGRNGAGKSSTLKSIMGIAPVSGGRIVFNGYDIQGLSPEQIACRGIGFVPQGRRLFANLTVEENLKIGALKRAGGDNVDGVAWSFDRVFEKFPRIYERLYSRADTLSGGEQQMVAIARALVGNVNMILMDEPFEGLSPVMIEDLFKSINALREEVAIVIVEHQLDLVLALADRAFILDQGTVSYEGEAQPLLQDIEFRKEKLWV